MNKNTLVGFALIALIIIGFGIYNRPSQEEMAQAQRMQDSIQQVIKQQEALQQKQASEAARQAIQVDSTSALREAVQGTEQFFTLEN